MIFTVKTIKTLQLRLKDKHGKALGAMAREVNQVFNFCNETSSRAIGERHQWLSGYDLQQLTAGFSKCDSVTVGSATAGRGLVNVQDDVAIQEPSGRYRL